MAQVENGSESQQPPNKQEGVNGFDSSPVNGTEEDHHHSAEHSSEMDHAVNKSAAQDTAAERTSTSSKETVVEKREPEGEAPPLVDEPLDNNEEHQTAVEEKEPQQQQQQHQEPPSISITDEPTSPSRERSDSRSTAATFSTHRSGPVSSTVFIVTALDTIGSSKEARKDKELDEAVKEALVNVKQSEQKPIDPEIIFRPLHLATKSFSIPLQVTALDCIGKLITYSYFAFPSSANAAWAAENEEPQQQRPSLIERAIDAICDCFENEATPVEVQQQIIKSLLAAVLNDKIVVHGAGLLKAVRQIYNIFIYSKSSQNQQVAQGSLTQMISTVYDRVRVRLELKELRSRETRASRGSLSDATTVDAQPLSPTNDHETTSGVQSPTATTDQQPVAKEPIEKLTLQSFESPKEDSSVHENAPTMVTRARAMKASSRSISDLSVEKEEGEGHTDDDVDEIYTKDAFLVFRALCKLSHKVLSHEQQQDIRSQNMRSKLLSLHLIHYVINNNVEVFTSPLVTVRNSSNSHHEAHTFLQAVRPHLCLSLSRNGSSSIQKVFEVCCEIFWVMLKNMRVMMKVSSLLFFFFFFLSAAF